MPLEYLKTISELPAPTFAEQARADLIESLWQGLGYTTQRDEAGNVLTQVLPEAGEGSGAALLLGAHLDTVFAAHTDVTVREEGAKWIGPGLGDNSASLATVTALLRDHRRRPLPLTRPLWVMANVGEEGLGDLRGAKHVMAQHHAALGAFIAVDGYLGSVVTQAIGVRRYRASFSGPGGHSWGDDAPSAIHALGLAVTSLYGLRLPRQPRTTLNVGLVSGGRSVNSIASEAELLLDLRSLDAGELRTLDERALGLVHQAARQAGVNVQVERVGDRPGGELQAAPLLGLIERAAEEQGLTLRRTASSTDANATVPYGVPAVSLGVYRGGNAHREDEWVDPRSLADGLNFLRRITELYQHRPAR